MKGSAHGALEILKTGEYVLLERISKTQGKVVVRGRALLDPNRVVTFTKESGPLACRSAGKYRWTRNGRRLTLARPHDTCTGRRTILGGVFKLVG